VSTPPPSEAARPASTTLDERIARDCQRSGVPFHVADDHLLDRVATWVELATEAHDHGDLDRPRRATVRHQGRGRGRGASGNGAAVLTGARQEGGAP
jgi:molybdopterin-guanine dinucleotide biosynthesis protein